MIVYNKTWLNNLYVHHKVEREQSSGYLTAAEVDAVKLAYPVGFYMPTLFVHIGIFILTCIIVACSAGLLTLIADSARVVSSFGWPIFLGLLGIMVLEIMIRSKNHYRSGADDALLWMAGLFLTFGFSLMLEKITGNYKTDYLAMSIFILVLSTVFTLRYLDTVASIVATLSFFAVIFFSVQKIGPVGEAIMPFVIIIAAGIVYALSARLSHKLTTPYYANILTFVQIVSLIILYAAGNYYVVDRLNNVLKDLPGVSGNLQLGFFFWGWTMLLPVVYLLRGVFKKDILLLRIGILLIGAAVYTFRTYYHVLSAEAALTIGGVIVLVAAYCTIQYLKTPKHGFTYDDTDQSDPLDNIQIESLITAETLNHTPHTPTASRFGGGSFGGGGSSGGF